MIRHATRAGDIVNYRRKLAERVPAMLAHEGTWEGNYRHYALDGKLLDEHTSRVECLFPDDGPYAYLQRNRFEWPDGRVVESEFGGTLEGRRICWDTERFAGYAWQAGDRVVLLTLERRDAPGESFTEAILLGDDGRHRVRTWHWLRAGAPFKVTIVSERRVTPR